MGENDKSLLKAKQIKWKQLLKFPFATKENKEKEDVLTDDSLKDVIGTKKVVELTETSISKHYSVATCCHPIPGDDVLGYLDEDSHLIIHKRQCPVAVRLQSSQGNRIIATEWNTHRELSFLVTIYIKGIDRMGLLNDVTQFISQQMNVNMRKLNIETIDGVFEGKIQLYVYDANDVKELCDGLKRIKNIKQVSRMEE